jgi:multiple sugar transport system substrate-binding protein
MSDAWSWEAFITQTDKLTRDESGRSPSESGFDPKKVRRYGVAAPTDLPTLHGLFKSNGLDLFNEDGTECRINSAEAIEVIKSLSDLIHVHRVAPTPAQASALGSGAALLLQSGRVATTMAGQWILIDLAEGKVPYGVGVLPSFGEPFVCVVGGANAVFTGAPNRELAFEWMDFLASPEECDLYRRGLWMPMEKKYYTDDALIDLWVDEKVHTAAYRTAVLQPMIEHPAPYFSFKIKNFPKIESVLSGGIAPILAQPTDVAAKLNALAEEIKPLLEGAYPDVREGS